MLPGFVNWSRLLQNGLPARLSSETDSGFWAAKSLYIYQPTTHIRQWRSAKEKPFGFSPKQNQQLNTQTNCSWHRVWGNMYIYIYIYITFLANAHFAIGPVGAALVAALQSIVFRWQDVRCSNDSNGKPAWHSFAQTFLDTTMDKARPIY